MSEFQLDQRLAAGTYPVADLRLSRLLLMNDKRFPWLILVPMRAEARELIDLLPGDQQRLLREITEASRLLQTESHPDKLNIAMLGNKVSQLHVHIIARFEKDAAWPNPVWGVGEAQPYSAQEAADIVARFTGRFA